MTTATVLEHVETGEIKAKSRTTQNALEFAATWLEAYEGDPEDDRDNLTDLATVAQYLRREASKRKR
jgi:hypothetical protein